MYPSAKQSVSKMHVQKHAGGSKNRRKEHVNTFANCDIKGGHSSLPTFDQSDMSNSDLFIEINLSDSNTISASINGNQVESLIDTGASINLIDHDWVHAKMPSIQHMIQKPRIQAARAANGSDLKVTGFVMLLMSINGVHYPVPLNIARNLSSCIILGRQFLKQHGAVIDCGRSKLKLKKRSQIRVVEKQEIPPHTQSVVRAKISNKLPVNTVGLCQGGRRVTALGILVANTVSSIDAQCAHLVVMNTTDEPIILYPRTKLGTFTLMNHENVVPFPDLDEKFVNEINTSSINDSRNDESKLQEVLSKVTLNENNLSSSEMSEITNLFHEYIDIFKVEGGPHGSYSGVKHEIKTNGHPPIRSRPYRYTPHIQAEIRKQVNEMLEQGIIKESTSPWCFPVCMVPKAGSPGSYRFAINFKKLNDICPRDNFPLPNINDALDSLGATKPKYFSTLDLASGYWQLSLTESSKPLTAFVTQDGLYEFQRMPFGLHNAPATFQRAMQEVLRGLNWKFVLCYLDDVIIFSNSFSEHLSHLKQVFDRFRQAGLKLQPKKCSFGQKEVKYLGHIVSEKGVATDPDKVKLVKEYPTPTKVSEVRSFLGFVGYYRKYVKDFCKIAEPLTNLTRKDVHFVWDERCINAFETLKQKLQEPPILAYPRFDGTEFILQTDASRVGLGFILAQNQDGKERVISYGGRALHAGEKNYTTTELEALAVVEGVKKYAPYLQHGVKFTVVTDHCALKWLFNKKQTNGHLARWAIKLQAYKFDVIHVRGRNNGNADALSRLNFDKLKPCVDCNHSISDSHDNDITNVWVQTELDKISQDVMSQSLNDNETNVHHVQNDSKPDVNVIRNLRYQQGKRITKDNDDVKNNENVKNKDVPDFPQEIDIQKFKEALLTDTFASSMLEFLEHDKLPDNTQKAKNLLLQADQYYVQEGLLYHIWHTPAKRHLPERNVYQLYVPVTWVDTVLNHCHDHVLAAHFGFQRTYSKIRQRYFWKGMYRDVDNWVRSCISCSQRKTHRHKVIAPLVTMKVPGAFERVSVDLLGPLPTTTSGNRHVLCFTDHCTRWPILIPLKVTDSATIARAFFDHIICNHGCPQTLLSDRGTNFLSKIVLEVCRIMRTHKLNTSSYHPQCNAIQERYNAVILDTISHYTNEFQNDWDQYITAIQFAYRTTPAENSVGFSPFFLLYGREARLPLDITLTPKCEYTEKNLREHIHKLVSQLEVVRKISQRHAEQNQAKMKERYDERASEIPFQVGDSVWIYIPAVQPGLSRKLMKFWSGPYLLVEQTGPVNFRVRNLENNKLVKSPIHVNRMKFAYERYVRPSNDTAPLDLGQRDPIPGLVQEDCPEDSFVPLLASQESDKDKIPIIPGFPVAQDNTTEYQIERIIRGRFKNGRLEYLIKWKDFPNSRNTWEPETNLNAAARESLKTNPVKITGKL
jgi:hypothetical protein